MDTNEGRTSSPTDQQNSPSLVETPTIIPVGWNDVIATIKSNAFPISYYTMVFAILCATPYDETTKLNIICYIIKLCFFALSLTNRFYYIFTNWNKPITINHHTYRRDNPIFSLTICIIIHTASYIIQYITLKNAFATNTPMDIANIISFATINIIFIGNAFAGQTYNTRISNKIEAVMLQIGVTYYTCFAIGEATAFKIDKQTTTTICLLFLHSISTLKFAIDRIFDIIMLIQFRKQKGWEFGHTFTTEECKEFENAPDFFDSKINWFFILLAIPYSMYFVAIYGSFSSKSCESVTQNICIISRNIAVSGYLTITALSIALLCFIVIICVTCCVEDRKKIIRWIRRMQMRYGNNILKPFLPNVEDECPICLEHDNGEWIKTRCDHGFHRTCLEEYLKTNFTCPTCRQDIVNAEDLHQATSNETTKVTSFPATTQPLQEGVEMV